MKKPLTSRQAKAMWNAVAAGSQDPEVIAWLQDVAKKLDKEIFTVAGFDPSSGRARRALEIVGFRYRIESDLEATVREVGSDYPSDTLAAVLPLVADVGKRGSPKQIKKAIENYRAKHRRK